GPCDCGAQHNAWSDAPPHLRERRERLSGAKANGAAAKPWNIPDAEVEMLHRYEHPESGELLFEVVRFAPEARERLGAKTMPRHQRDGRWYFGAGPWAGRSDELPLYREREAVAELRQGGTVRIVEGERDADVV